MTLNHVLVGSIPTLAANHSGGLTTTRKGVIMFGLGIVGTIIVILLILWLLGVL